MKVRVGNAHIPRDQTVGTDLDALLGHDERAVKQSKITDHSRAVFSNGERAASVTRDVIPDAHDTLAGIDGLYWYKGDLIGVQYGTAAFRVMRWHLAPDGKQVESSKILERGTELVKDPTTGAIFEGKFYFMANTGIDNLKDDRIVDESKLEPVKIAAIALK